MSKEISIKKNEMQKEEIPVPINRCLFLDLDTTLIDETYGITDSEIFKNIERLQNMGWEIGLNSNTPMEPLLVWASYFGIKGSIIAEKGSVIYDNDSLIFDQGLAKQIQASKEAIRISLEATNTQWLPGNPVDIIRENKFEGLESGPLVLLNTVRKCSLGFYVREVTSNGEIVVNPNVTTDILRRLKSYWPNPDKFEENVSFEKGIFLSMPRNQTKRLGTMIFMKNRSFTQVGIVGDSMGDFLGEDIALHYAVSNAQENYKNRSVFVSKFPLTKGCSDILRRLARAPAP